jgi:hypothetical protein
MKNAVTWVCALLLVVVAGGCTSKPTTDPTIPPFEPVHKIDGSVWPKTTAGYTLLGGEPTSGQVSATYARDTAPLDLAVATFDPTGEFGQTKLSGQQWYGASRCGTIWEGDSSVTPQPIQAACITVLLDGVMTTVAGGDQTPSDLAALANALYAGLA